MSSPTAWTFEAIGTRWSIISPAPIASDVRRAVSTCIDTFDRDWSRFRDDSWISRVAAAAGEHRLPPGGERMFALYDALHDVTDGAVNPLVGRSLVTLGYDADYSLRPTGEALAAPTWPLARDAGVVTTTEPVLIDVGAVGKGLLVDLVSAVLTAHGVLEHTVDGSGDLRHQRRTPLRVGLEHPGDPTRALGMATLTDGQALCGSATNRRSWGDGLHHVLDARTGHPTDDVVATWVVAGDAVLADGLATAHFFAEPERLLGRFDHEFVRVHRDGRLLQSTGFPGEVFA